MGVHLREKKLKNGLASLYLDYYPPIRKEDGSHTRREFLKKTIYVNPKNAEEKKKNKENRNFANRLLYEREREILNEENGIFNTVNKKRDFLKYFQDLADRRKKIKGTYDSWLSSLNYLTKFTGGKCLMGDINMDFCNRFKEYLLSTEKLKTVKELKLSNNSALSYFNKFRAAIKEAFYARYIEENPLKHIKSIPQKETKKEFLTKEELQKLASTDCESALVKKAVLFSALSGFRWSDVIKLKWKDIQHTASGFFIHIYQEKTEDVIMHPISNKAVELLGQEQNPDDKIFDGLKYSDSINKIIKRWVLEAKIYKKITFHNFRHTYATLLLNNGNDILTVSKMMGHKNLKTTQIYAKVLTKAKTDAANSIDIQL